MQIAKWALWQQKRAVILLVLLSVVVAIAGLARTEPSETISHAFPFAVLGALTVLYSVLTRHSERLINALREGTCPNLLGIFTFAGAILLPPNLIVALVTVAYVADWPTRRSHGGALFKHVLTAAGVTLGCYASAGVMELLDGPASVAMAILSFTAVNVGLVATAVWMAGARQILRMFLSVRAHATELATQASGAALAFMFERHAIVAALVLPGVYGFQRLTIAGRVAESNPRDPDTGLWTERAWSVLLAEAVVSARRFGVFVVEAGTANPGDVHDALREHLTPGIEVGQLSSGQLVLMTPAMTLDIARLIANRYAAHLAQAGFDVAVGTAAGGWPGGPDQHDVMISALSSAVSLRAARSTATA